MYVFSIMRQNRLVLFALLFLTLVALLVIVFMNKEYDNVNWEGHYQTDKKDPYGTYILYQSIPQIFPGSTITRNTQNIFIDQKHKDYLAQAPRTVYCIVSPKSNIRGSYMSFLQDFVAKGGVVWIMSEKLNPELEQLLQIQSTYYVNNNPQELTLGQTTAYYDASAPRQNTYTTNYLLPSGFDAEVYPLLYDNKQQLLLASTTKTLAKGGWLIGASPKLVANYYLLQPNTRLVAETILTHLPNREYFVWETYKSYTQETQGSIWSVVWAHKPLRFAAYLCLLTAACYLLFESRRRQRIVPLIEAPTNSNLNFVKSVGSLYYHYRDHSKMAQKKVHYFLEYLRHKLHIPTQELSPTQLHQTLAARLPQFPETDLRQLISLCEKGQQKQEFSQNQLIQLGELIYLFKKEVG